MEGGHATALWHRSITTPCARGDPDDPFTGLVFCRPDGRPLGPHHVLDRLHQLSVEAGVPRISVHDLRHLAATITITVGVPLTVVFKTLRHSTLSGRPRDEPPGVAATTMRPPWLRTQERPSSHG
ncbi:tyrosine-type recombinase/integrase [Streptomyces sp. E-08]|uniref:tyrosine-type recombinase/integrase n=1 Tax=Streptomyces sp. E-08 TaxID=3404047 RepID=UPI003CE769DC